MMWNRMDLKANAKIAFQRNYWTCVAVSVVAAFLSGELGASTRSASSGAQTAMQGDVYGSGIFHYGWSVFFLLMMIFVGVIVVLISVLVSNTVKVGKSRYYMENREHKTKMTQLFYGFRNGRYGNIVLTMFLKSLYVFLWSLLLFIPGIIKEFSYMLVPYILSENPDMDHRRALELSRQMMDGYKAEAFVLGLSFLGWELLGVMTCGILNIFYVSPYMDAAYAEFYAAVKSDAMQKGITSEYELPGHFYETY